VLLSNGVRPCRAKRLEHHNPSLLEFAALDPIGLHSSPAAAFAGFRIGPFKRKAEPCAIALEGMVVYNHAYIRALLPRLGNLCGILFAGYYPVALFIMTDVVCSDALGD